MKTFAITILQGVVSVIDRLLSIFTWFLPEKIRNPAKVLTLAVFLFAVLLVGRQEAQPLVLQERAWVVESSTIAYQATRPIIPAYGEVVAARQIDLRALVAGEVISVAPTLEEGALVKKGETLLQIDPFVYENALGEAKAQALGAEASYMTAKTDFERAQTLIKKGTVSKKYLEDTRANYLVKKSTYDRLKIAVRRAERNLKNTNVVAPFDAYVSNVNAREGRLVGNNDFVARLSDAHNYELRFNLSDAEYGALLNAGSDIVGRPVKATWTIGNREIVLQAKVRRVGASIDRSTRGVDVYADVVTPENGVLRGGAFVKVALQGSLVERAALIPTRALYDNAYVYVIKDDRLAQRQVDVLLQTGGQVYITAGLEAGEQILLTRFNEVASGVLVKTLDEQGDG